MNSLLRKSKSLFMLLCFANCFEQNNFCTENKIIFCFFPVRALSTALLRSMESLGLKVMNEPYFAAYHIAAGNGELLKGYFREDAPMTFEEVAKNIFSEVEHNHVFIKEPIISGHEIFTKSPELSQDPQSQFIFLIRRPDHIIKSYYRICATSPDTSEKISQWPKGLLTRLIGYKTMYETLQLVKDQGKRPLIILSEDLYSHPSETVKTLCDNLGIPFREQALQWNNLGNTFVGNTEWSDPKVAYRVQQWHGDAIKSTGFHCPRYVAYTPLTEEPIFEDITDPNDLQVCIGAYKENLPYYRLLVAEKQVATR